MNAASLLSPASTVQSTTTGPEDTNRALMPEPGTPNALDKLPTKSDSNSSSRCSISRNSKPGNSDVALVYGGGGNRTSLTPDVSESPAHVCVSQVTGHCRGPRKHQKFYRKRTSRQSGEQHKRRLIVLLLLLQVGVAFMYMHALNQDRLPYEPSMSSTTEMLELLRKLAISNASSFDSARTTQSTASGFDVTEWMPTAFRGTPRTREAVPENCA